MVRTMGLVLVFVIAACGSEAATFNRTDRPGDPTADAPVVNLCPYESEALTEVRLTSAEDWRRFSDQVVRVVVQDTRIAERVDSAQIDPPFLHARDELLRITHTLSDGPYEAGDQVWIRSMDLAVIEGDGSLKADQCFLLDRGRHAIVALQGDPHTSDITDRAIVTPLGAIVLSGSEVADTQRHTAFVQTLEALTIEEAVRVLSGNN